MTTTQRQPLPELEPATSPSRETPPARGNHGVAGSGPHQQGLFDEICDEATELARLELIADPDADVLELRIPPRHMRKAALELLKIRENYRTQLSLFCDPPAPTSAEPLARGRTYSQEEIAEREGISLRWVRTLEQRALERLYLECLIDPDFRNHVIAVLGRAP